MTNARWMTVLVVAGCQQDRPSPKRFVPAMVVAEPAKPAPPLPLPPPLPIKPPDHQAPAVVVPVPRLVKWFRALPKDDHDHVAKACAARAADPCGGLLRAWTEDHPDPTVALFASLTDPQRKTANQYCEYANRHARGCNTPLVLALDNRPIELAPPTSIAFAFQSDERVTSAWPTVATPWLAMDRDGDGAITSGAELFGDGTRLADGTLAPDGYAALAALDKNHDGVIDAKDPAFTALLLWSDLDGDRKSSPNELRPLSSVVTSIPLAHDKAPRCDRDGNCEGERGSAELRDGHEGAIVDLYLRALN
jgi:hypothetical protein